jgi:hypothetical protein
MGQLHSQNRSRSLEVLSLHFERFGSSVWDEGISYQGDCNSCHYET